MFHPEAMNIPTSGCVLEIGPGSTPHPRANFYLDLWYCSDNESYIQSGFAQRKLPPGKSILYGGGVFPFIDNAFEYIICSHVLEHIETEEIPLFLSEMTRVSRRGFVEVPSALYELFNWQPVHRTLFQTINNSLQYIDKCDIPNSSSAESMRLAIRRIPQLYSTFINANKDIFFLKMEWDSTIPINKHLGSSNDFLKSSITSMSQPPPKSTLQAPPIRPGFVKCVIIKIGWFIHRLLKMRPQRRRIHKSAILEHQKRIQIAKTAEIGAFCLLSAPIANISIGEKTQINTGCVILGGVGISIGKMSMIGPNTVLAAGSHDYTKIRIPMMEAGNRAKGPITIGDDVWIGANCTILDGTTIEEGCVVAANSKVTGYFPAGSVLGGNPAHVLFNRRVRYPC